MPGVLMPGPSGVGEVYVEPRDTRLAEVLDDRHQLPWTRATAYKDSRWLYFVPVSMFQYFSRSLDDHRARKARFDATPWSVSHAYNVTHLDATRFRFSVPNPLDAVLFVKWWLEAGIPCAEAALTAMLQ